MADDAAEPAQPKSAPADRQTAGPFDVEEAPAVPYVDLGGLRIATREGLGLRVEVEESTKRVVAVGLEYAGSTLQLQAFAAPRSSGLWHEIREQISGQIAKQGGRTSLEYGVFGPEVRAEFPVAAADGSAQRRRARFIGVDGPRWFLRGVIGGRALDDASAADGIEQLYRSVVVVRGQSPMPPRDLIPLNVPNLPTARQT